MHPIVDVGQQHAPATDPAAGIAEWETAVLHPAVDAITPPEALHDFIRGPGRNRTREHVDNVRQIVGMYGAVGAPVSQFLQALAERRLTHD